MKIWKPPRGVKLLAGVDEAGRGPLAGDVVTAAVILPRGFLLDGLGDSKTLSAENREILYEQICERASSWCVARATVEEIDNYNILQATLMAMRRAVLGLSTAPEFVAVDGNMLPEWEYRSEAVVKGDAKVAAISAASILAKVTRDREMVEFEAKYPGYGFASNKGYATPQHLEALKQLGPTPIHRQSFSPIRTGPKLKQQNLF